MIFLNKLFVVYNLLKLFLGTNLLKEQPSKNKNELRKYIQYTLGNRTHLVPEGASDYWKRPITEQ